MRQDRSFPFPSPLPQFHPSSTHSPTSRQPHAVPQLPPFVPRQSVSPIQQSMRTPLSPSPPHHRSPPPASPSPNSPNLSPPLTLPLTLPHAAPRGAPAPPSHAPPVCDNRNPALGRSVVRVATHVGIPHDC
ncbi:unnamed protein product [Closterium sp. Naga37s-1]|nr:unnamed protein product [Closterium sp. Naga37s-1]